MNPIPWSQGAWVNPPLAENVSENHLLVDAVHESDFWRHTSYGFVHDSGHALLKDFPDKTSAEVSFIVDYVGQFDQAGIIVYADSEHWIKSGVEFADGAPQVGAVVTSEFSDWSLAPVPEWAGKEVTIRVSRSGGALTIRVRCNGEDRLLRLAPINPDLPWRAGPHCASPISKELKIRFTSWQEGDADSVLH